MQSRWELQMKSLRILQMKPRTVLQMQSHTFDCPVCMAAVFNRDVPHCSSLPEKNEH